MATEEHSRARVEKHPEMAAPRRPQQARNPVKKATVSKKRVMRINTHPKRQSKKYSPEVRSPSLPPTNESGAPEGFELQARPMEGAGRAPLQSLFPAPQM
jgi:hypothetical protein